MSFKRSISKRKLLLLTFPIILLFYVILLPSNTAIGEGVSRNIVGDVFIMGGTASAVIDIRGLEQAIGSKVAVVDNISELSGRVRAGIPLFVVSHVNDIVVMDRIDELSGLLSSILNKSGRFQMIIITGNNVEYASLCYELWLKALGKLNYKPKIFLVDPEQRVSDKRYEGLKIDSRLFKSSIIAFSYNPYGIILVENVHLLVSDIADCMMLFQNTPNKKAFSTNSITRMEGFDFLGYIGWKNAEARGWLGELAGEMWVKAEYYYGSQTATDGTVYKFFYAYVIHSAKGYSPFGISRPPGVFITRTDWKTRYFEGQVLWDWGPKNVGGPLSTITYSVTAGTSGQKPTLLVEVSYSSPSGTYFKWFDQTDPGDGIAEVKHEVVNSMTYATFTVEPSSIGLLDPNKQGGYEPMLVKHYMKTLFTDIPAEISFNVMLYSDSSPKEY